MANDTKVAALLKPSTTRMHTKLQEAIVDLLQNYPGNVWTRQIIAKHLGKGVHCVCAPVKALLDAGLIVEHSRVWNNETHTKNWSLKLKEVE